MTAAYKTIVSVEKRELWDKQAKSGTLNASLHGGSISSDRRALWGNEKLEMGSSPEGLANTHTWAHTKDSSLEKIRNDACVFLSPLSQSECNKCSRCVVPARRPPSRGHLLDLTQLQEIVCRKEKSKWSATTAMSFTSCYFAWNTDNNWNYMIIISITVLLFASDTKLF